MDDLVETNRLAQGKEVTLSYFKEPLVTLHRSH